jgi:PAS domain S-box-containing protein
MNKLNSKCFQIFWGKESLLYFVLAIAALTLIGWLSNNIWLSSFSHQYKPTSPIVAITFLALCILLYVSIKTEKSRLEKTIVTPSVIIIMILYIVIFLGYFLDFSLHLEKVLVADLDKFGNTLTGFMSPIASVLFLFICFSILSLRYKKYDIIQYIGGSLSLLTSIVSFIFFIGYLYKAPLLYGGKIIPVAFPAALCFLFFSITLLRLFELRYWTYNLIMDNKITNLLLKSFLPIVAIIVLMQGFADTLFSSTRFNEPVSGAIILLIVIAISIAVFYRVSSIIGSDLVKAEKSLKESEQRFSRAVQFAPFPVMIHSEDGKVLSISQGWTDSSGYTMDDIPTIEEWTELAYGTRKHLVKEDIDALYKMTGSKNEGEYKINSKSGTERIWDFSSAFLGNFDNAGRVVISMAKDVTDRKLAEDALKIKEVQLIRLNADKDRFISILGHDLKSPFNNILGLSEVLTEEIHQLRIDEIEDIANNIFRSSKITNNLLEDILMWARSQSGHIRFKPLEISFYNICKNIIEVLNPNSFAKNITIYCPVIDNIVVYADIDMLKTILLNLISNAIKFTNKGGSINIHAELNSEYVTITVSDNGIGIAKDDIVKLFDISQVLTTKGTDGETGTGLGLLICKDFVEKHNGQIRVTSEVGKGSEFIFTLPCHPVEVIS